MDRRGFNRLCSTLVAGASALSLELAGSSKVSASESDRLSNRKSQQNYPRSKLIGVNGKAITASGIPAGSSHIFSYPYKTTPCFLLRLSPASLDRQIRVDGVDLSTDDAVVLSDSQGRSYTWKGGVGADQSIVAFSAICTHKMSHPAKPVSHLNFRPEEKTVRQHDGATVAARELIYCCSEHSAYDPAAGAKVLSGPATQPLAAIELQVNERDEIEAVGTYGSNLFEQFLEKFGFRQAMEQGISDPYEPAGDDTVVTLAEDYSKLQILC